MKWYLCPAFALFAPARERIKVLARDGASIGVTQQILEKYLQRVRQARKSGVSLLFRSRKTEVGHATIADAQLSTKCRPVHEPRLSPTKHLGLLARRVGPVECA